MYLNPYRYELDEKGNLQQCGVEAASVREILCLSNSLVLNYYIRSKVTTHVSLFQFLELPVPEIKPTTRKRLVSCATKLLKNPRDVKERAALEIFIARELYGLSLDDWKHLTGTFTFGSGETKAELDEIIRLSLAF